MTARAARCERAVRRRRQFADDLRQRLGLHGDAGFVADRGQPLGSRGTGNPTGLRKLKVGPDKGYRAVIAARGDVLALVVQFWANRCS